MKKKTVKPDDIMDSFNSVVCQLCDKRTRTISEAHLRTHGSSLSDYRARFPDAALVSDEIRQKLSADKKGKTRSEEYCRAASERRKGKQPEHLKGLMTTDLALKIARARLPQVTDEHFTILYDKEKLQETLLRQSMSLTAEEFGVSISLISKRCKMMGIKG